MSTQPMTGDQLAAMPEVLTEEQLTEIKEHLGDTAPATNQLITALAEGVHERRKHEHPKWEDLFCANLEGWAGERIAFVLQRLVATETENRRLRAELSKAPGPEPTQEQDPETSRAADDSATA